MKMPALVVALFLASFATLAAQQPALSAKKINMVVVEKTSFESVVRVVAAVSGIAIEFDDSVPVELRNRQVGHVTFKDADFERAMQFLIGSANLTYTVLSPTSIRIELRAAARR